MLNYKAPSEPTQFLASVKTMLEGMGQVLPKGSKLLVAGVEISRDQLIAQLEEMIVPFQQAADLRAQYEHALKVRTSQQEASTELVNNVRLALLNRLGTQSPELPKVGLTPEKARAKLTAEQQMQKVEKLRQTRQLRHTLGSKQKSGIKAGSAPVSEVPQQPGDGNAVPSPVTSPSNGSSQATGTTGSTNGAPSP
jgi:hypothetical protein